MPHHIMFGVKSSAIDSISHDAAAGTLRVRFHSGRTYEYPDVTAEEHAAFVGAESIGKHFNQHIRAKAGKRIEE